MANLADIGNREERNERIGSAIESDYEKARRNEHIKREELYRDGGDQFMDRYIDKTFAENLTKEKRKVFIEWAKNNNVTKRIVNEKSTVYKEEPKRTVSAADFRDLERMLLLNLVMREADRRLSLHNDVLLYPRIRKDGKKVLDIVTPDLVTPIVDSTDHTMPLGWVVHQAPVNASADYSAPHGRLWCADASVLINADGHQIGAPEPNPWGRVPFVHVSAVPPGARGMLLDHQTGQDMIATHLSVWYQHIMGLKESKSSTKQTVLSGDTSLTPSGQIQDSEEDLILGEGVTATTLDRGTDQKQFRDNADFLLERCAGNHGIAPQVLRHDGASSGFEIALRRIPIRELRQERIPIWRLAERELLGLMSVVFGFDVDLDAFAIDFGEVETPMSPSERIDVFVKERQASLVTTREEIQRRNPDLSEDAAAVKLLTNINEEGMRVKSVNEHMSGSFGANNAPKSDSDDENDENMRFDA